MTMLDRHSCRRTFGRGVLQALAAAPSGATCRRDRSLNRYGVPASPSSGNGTTLPPQRFRPYLHLILISGANPKGQRPPT